MHEFRIPERSDVSPENQKYFDFFQIKLGLVPNFYAALAYSENALGNYLKLQGRKRLFNRKEQEVIALVVSTFNNSVYCLAAHTAIARLNNLTDGQIQLIKQGIAPFNLKFDVLSRLVHQVMRFRGKVDESLLREFFRVGYHKSHLIELMLEIGALIISNILSCSMNIPIDPTPDTITLSKSSNHKHHIK